MMTSVLEKRLNSCFQSLGHTGLSGSSGQGGSASTRAALHRVDGGNSAERPPGLNMETFLSFLHLLLFYYDRPSCINV